MENQEVKLIPRQIREADYPTARFLSEKEQEKYRQEIQRYSEKARSSLDIPLKGSNLWKVLLLNQIGIRTATIPELEEALENGLSLKRTYEDGREVILRSKGDSYNSNDYVAKNLVKRLGIKRQIKTPLIITDLKPVEDENSDYGLIAQPTNQTKVIEASDFNHKNNGRRFRRINPDYSIEFDYKGSRTLYTRESGLFRLYLFGDLDLLADSSHLALSNSDGRVVIVSGEASAQKK